MNELENNNNLEAKVSKKFEVADGAGVSIATIDLTPLLEHVINLKLVIT